MTALEMLNLHATIEDTDTHHRQKVVRGVGVIVNAAEKGSGSIITDGTLDKVSTARMILGKR